MGGRVGSLLSFRFSLFLFLHAQIHFCFLHLFISNNPLSNRHYSSSFLFGVHYIPFSHSSGSILSEFQGHAPLSHCNAATNNSPQNKKTTNATSTTTEAYTHTHIPPPPLHSYPSPVLPKTNKRPSPLTQSNQTSTTLKQALQSQIAPTKEQNTTRYLRQYVGERPLFVLLIAIAPHTDLCSPFASFSLIASLKHPTVILHTSPQTSEPTGP